MIPIDPLRRELVQEMHLRPSPCVKAPARVVQILGLGDEDENDELPQHLIKLGFDTEPNGVRRNGLVEREGVRFLWERHSEAATLTGIIDQDVRADSIRSAMEDLVAIL